MGYAPSGGVKGQTDMKRLGLWSLAGGLVVGFLALAPSEAAAQDEVEGGVIYQKKTIISFGEDTIDGDLLVPDGEYVESRKRVRHSNLIRIREDFREKILRSVSVL